MYFCLPIVGVHLARIIRTPTRLKPCHHPTSSSPNGLISPFRKRSINKANKAPLQDPAHMHEIRLIYLDPGRGNTPLVCQLRRVSLTADLAPYDAISYCWGGQEPSRTIMCDNIPMPITQSLHDALCRFRSPDRTTALWADAICINQEDLKEKSQQLPLMGRIYSQANEVKVWLGPANDETPQVAVLVKEICRLAQECATAHELTLDDMFDLDSSEWEEAAADTEEALEKRDHDWDIFIRFLKNPWFSRSWVIQEVALSRGRAHLYCGDTVSWLWDDVVVAIFFSFHSDILADVVMSEDPENALTAHRVGALAKTTTLAKQDTEEEGIDLLWLLYTNSPSLATNPLDKVYAILGIAKNEDPSTPSGQIIVPDYRLDAATLYQQVSEIFLARFPKFYILTGAGIRLPHPSQTPGLPSWVIDWNYEEVGSLSKATDLDEQCRDGAASFDPSLVDEYPKFYEVRGKVLKLSGIIIDEIVEYANPWSTEVLRASSRTLSWSQRGMLHLTGFKTAAKVWAKSTSLKTTYKFTGEPIADAMFKTMLVGDEPESLSDGRGGRGVKDLVKIAGVISFMESSPLAWTRLGRGAGLSSAPYLTGVYWSEEALAALPLLASATANQMVFRTRKGYIGLTTTRQVRVGDRIAIVRGGQVAFVLRPAGGDTWLLVGETYVHGIMDGEAFDIDKCSDIFIV